MSRVKITVLKKYFDEEMADEYLTDGREVGPCQLLQVGDVFWYEGGAEMPKGMCPWAWIDIYRGVSEMESGATKVPWQKRHGTNVYCCTDGIRPVVFAIEAEEYL